MNNTALDTREAASAGQHKAIQIIANSMFRQFMSNGYSRAQIICFTSELLQLLLNSIRSPAVSDESLTNEAHP